MSTHANLYDFLSSGFPADRTAVAIETPARTYSWADIDNISARYATLLQSLNVPQGARVAVQVEKSPEALMLYLATVRAGLVYLPLNTAYTLSELGYFIGDAEPSVIVCDPSRYDTIQPLANGAGTAHVFTLDANGQGSLAHAAAPLSSQFHTVPCQPHDLAAILYTSGTTGRSKGAMLSHANLAANAGVLHQYWGWKSNDVLLHMLPIFHVHGLFVASQGALLAGARMIWLPKLDIEQALAYLPRCTLMMGVPTYYVRLLADSRFTQSVCSNMRLFISGSAPLLRETFEQFQQRTGHTILERYGMSETNMLTSNPYHPDDGQRIAGTVGKPLPGVSVRVVNDDLQPLPAGQIGSVQVCGPNVFSGYWRMPEKTRQEFTTDGWFRTGDLGHWGGSSIPDDYLTIVGRSKDLIISGGYNVYPKEVELVLDNLPGVAESAVIGVPHPDFGEAVVAVVVPAQGQQPQVDTLLASLKDCLANYKVPKAIHFASELPRNTMGKVQKNVLRQQYSQAG